MIDSPLLEYRFFYSKPLPISTNPAKGLSGCGCKVWLCTFANLPWTGPPIQAMAAVDGCVMRLASDNRRSKAT
jgi:hypothetical protein